MWLKLLLVLIVCILSARSDDEGSADGLDDYESINENGLNLRKSAPLLNGDNEFGSTSTTTVPTKEDTNFRLDDNIKIETATIKSSETKPVVVDSSTEVQENDTRFVETNPATEVNKTISEANLTSSVETNPATESKTISDKNFTLSNPNTSTVTITTTTSITTSTTTTTPSPIIINFTRSTNVPSKAPSNVTEEATDDNISIFKAFNLNYLYFLLLLIPITGIGIWVTFCCKRKKRKEGYTEANVKSSKRRTSTPSWVFSEPDYADEEVITLEDEKK